MNNTVIIIIGLGVLGFGAWRFWCIWDERFAGRSMREQEREMALLAELQKAQTEAPETILVMDPPAPRLRSARPAPVTAASADAVTGKPAVPSAAILDAAGRVVFYMLKIAMPDHEILARVDTAALAGNSETLPPRAMLDFVVCKRDFTPVAVIVLMRGEDPLRDRAATLLEQRGLRVLRWAISALPERSSVRAIVLGQDAAQSTSAA